MTKEITLPNEEATIGLGGALASALPTSLKGWIVLLKGELGAGKSTLARALLRAMGHTGSVPSPTYTLVEPYELKNGNVYHIDLYRVSGLEELEYLGWQDLQDGLMLIEWPQRAPELDSRADLLIELSYAGDGRAASFKGLSDRGSELAARLVDHA